MAGCGVRAEKLSSQRLSSCSKLALAPPENKRDGRNIASLLGCAPVRVGQDKSHAKTRGDKMLCQSRVDLRRRTPRLRLLALLP